MRLPDPDGSRAVLIGTASYGPDSGFASFPEIERSLHDFAEFLCTETGLPEVATVLDPTDAVSFATAVEIAAQAATDVLLFYFVGHGVAVDNQLHLTHTGSLAAKAGFSTVSYPLLRLLIKASPARVKVVILDCCHSGKAFGKEVLAAGDEVLAEAIDIDGAFVLTATDEKTKFAAASGADGRTAFTGALLDILTAGIPSNDRFLTLSALYSELRARLPAANMPKPKALERGTAANLALAENAAWTEAKPALPDATATAYFAQIRDIAPSRGLVDRATELAELAQFCAGDEPYLRLSAGPWSGKTALMSWFALHPPEGVRVVAFFITSRLPAQSDHVAFTDAVLEQLAALLPEEGAMLAATSGSRDALRRKMFERVAQRASETGEKVVLLVDGLDEDRGTPSIASLLPPHPGPGLRVIVASRWNPPLPVDVSEHHSLRTCRRERLRRIEYADGFRRAAKVELGQLLNGSDEVRSVIGLVTVAGGLTLADLTELTGLPPFRIDGILSGVTGRTLSLRRLEFGADPVHLLAHETLQEEAENSLGPQLLGRYRNEIHRWADAHHREHWPDTTPRYLLTRYFFMLKAQGDVSRMAALALDRNRHDRMLRVVGGDIGARVEIEAVTELIRADPHPDLLTMCKLSMCRERIAERSNNIPIELPHVFALLGEHGRAASLARSIPDPRRRAAAHVRLLAVPRSPNDHHRDRAVAESLVLGLEDFTTQSIELVELVSVLLAAGDVDEAEILAQRDGYFDGIQFLTELAIAHHRAGRGEDALLAIEEARDLADSGPFLAEPAARYFAAALTEVGEFGPALEAARDIGDPVVQATALAALAARMVGAGDRTSAREISDGAVSLAATDLDPRRRGQITCAITPFLVSAGFGAEARALVAQLETLARGAVEPYLRSELERRLATCYADLGDPERAIACAGGVTLEHFRLEALMALVPKLIETNRREDALRLASRAESMTYDANNSYALDWLYIDLINVAGEIGDHAAALEHSRSIAATGHRFGILLNLAVNARESPDVAREYLSAAEELAREIQRDPRPPISPAVGDLLDPLVRCGELEHASQLVDELSTAIPARILDDRGHRWISVASKVASCQIELDRPIQAMELLRRFEDPTERLAVLVDVAPALREHGLVDLGRELAAACEVELIANVPEERWPGNDGPPWNSVLGQIMARLGEVDRAEEYLRLLRQPYFRSIVQYDLVGALALARDPARARTIANEIDTLDLRVHALTYLVVPFAEQDTASADEQLTLAERAAAVLDPGSDRDDVLAQLVTAAVSIGATVRAETIARIIGDPHARAAALTTIGNTLVDTPSVDSNEELAALSGRIRRLLIDIWSLSRWHTPIRIVSIFDRELLNSIIAVVNEEQQDGIA